MYFPSYLDNARVHKVRQVFRLFEEFRVQYFFSSPYSPDYNAIEYMFGYIKLAVKRVRNLHLIDAIKTVLEEIGNKLELFEAWVSFAAKNWQSDALYWYFPFGM